MKRFSSPVYFIISLNEILDELPRLTHDERRLLCRGALAIDGADDVATLEHTAAEGFAPPRPNGSGGRRAWHEVGRARLAIAEPSDQPIATTGAGEIVSLGNSSG